jgi:hypothetical protein
MAEKWASVFAFREHFSAINVSANLPSQWSFFVGPEWA